MTISIRPETPADVVAVREVNRRAFGRDGEARLVDALRDEGYVRVSLVAEVDGQVVGHVLFSELPIVIADGEVPALSLAPLAVLPEFQRRGIGGELVRHGLEICRERGHRIVIVLGWPHYYSRLGFSAALARPIESPYAGDAWMALELTPGSLRGITGRVEYPPPFSECG
ncbi:MAG: N-acetyltransferase [Planctomycetes bacterium]|nr:N-acetyltransferase [Planctomycetota bacterium]